MCKILNVLEVKLLSDLLNCYIVAYVLAAVTAEMVLILISLRTNQ